MTQLREPMVVVRIPTEHGTRPLPALDDSWSEIDRLRWCAGVALADTGARIRIAEIKHRLRRSTYCLTLPGVGLSDRSFNDTWDAIHNIALGYRLGLKGSAA